MDDLGWFIGRLSDARRAFIRAFVRLDSSEALRVLAGGDVTPRDSREMAEAVFCRDRLKKERELFHLMFGVI